MNNKLAGYIVSTLSTHLYFSAKCLSTAQVKHLAKIYKHKAVHKSYTTQTKHTHIIQPSTVVTNTWI